jgi:hypothetical protein
MELHVAAVKNTTFTAAIVIGAAENEKDEKDQQFLLVVQSSNSYCAGSSKHSGVCES